MNSQLFTQHFVKAILANLREPSLIIMDNASYHKTKAFQDPVSNWNKQQLTDWLQANGVEVPENVNKQQLLNMCAIHKKGPQLLLRALMEGKPHKLLFLPPWSRSKTICSQLLTLSPKFR